MAISDSSETQGRFVPASIRRPLEEHIKIPTADWFALPAELRRAIDGCPFVLAGRAGRENFVRAVLV